MTDQDLKVQLFALGRDISTQFYLRLPWKWRGPYDLISGNLSAHWDESLVAGTAWLHISSAPSSKR